MPHATSTPPAAEAHRAEAQCAEHQEREHDQSDVAD
jgi:hypothetical protein